MTIIYCDGGMNKHTGTEAWGSVVNKDGLDLIGKNLDFLKDFDIQERQLKKDKRFILISKFKDVTTQQNNGAELIAMIASLRIALQNKSENGLHYKEILTDSNLIYEYWSKGQINKKTLLKMDSNKKNLIFECKSLREEFEKEGGQIRKIEGKYNLADLGWHS